MQNPKGVRFNLAPFVFGPAMRSPGVFSSTRAPRRCTVFPMPDLVIVTLASLFAGCVDAIVGGGGLILVPALFSVYPGAVPATLLGTNKGASVWGTAWATGQFARRVALPWRSLGPAAAAALVGSMLGAWTLTQVPAGGLRKALPLVLLAVLVYTLARKDLGRTHAPAPHGPAVTATACTIGAGVGFYDGFFGPGTGSFFVFLIVRFLGYDFLNASASAKLLNTATNAAALVLFTVKGHVWWQVAGDVGHRHRAGSLLGTRLALRHGAGFVRVVFIVVVAALILKTAWDALTKA
jgi:uncharacterized membrane protein YfcA